MIYANDIDLDVCEWLAQLPLPIDEIDSRDIRDIKPEELSGFTQCHFFAGIGGWPLALSMAGWPVDLSIWSGSCPCQPFSLAGTRKGEKDSRHLWPELLRLIAELRPATIVGEQVAQKPGRDWFARVRNDLEKLGYVVGAADLCAAAAGAPHIRQRIYWMAHTPGARLPKWKPERRNDEREAAKRNSFACGMGYAESDRRQPRGPESGRQIATYRRRESGFWDFADYIYCRDNKYRPVEPGSSPLAHGVPGRVVRLRGLGNAIVPQLAAIFIRSYVEAAHEV